MNSDSLSPPSSIGHGRSSDVRHSPSHDILAAHPLLSPGPSSPTTSNASPESKAVQAPKYLPYTPRQRVPIGSATTGTTVHSSVSVSPQQHQGNATSKLQLQNLKAAAQSIGLDAGSLGWAMLEALVIGQDHSPAWNEIWVSIASGKATLLLPLEQAHPHDVMTAEFLKDHVVFCNGSSRTAAPLVTLSGLRGRIDEDITIVSTLSPSSKPFQALLTPSTRTSTLMSLPPLPIASYASALYPKYSVHSFSASLPLPPRATAPTKPPLPPRPGAARPVSASASRLSNPFASLFSKSPTPASPATPPAADPPLVDHVVDISAFTIDRPIIRRDVAKSITKAIKSEIKESLVGLPSWVVDRVQSFTGSLHPLTKTSKRSIDAGLNHSPAGYAVSTSEKSPDDMENYLQSFYTSLEEELSSTNSPSLIRRRDERNDDDREKSRREQEKVDNEVRTREILEKVERTICSIFYDRLFRQSTSDDGSHDEALSSRVAALHMLDLSLEHLGVDVGEGGVDVERVVAACGETISQLEFTRCPGDKASVLVAAHKIIVDGLSRLPPVHLKSEETFDDQKTPMASRFNRSNDSDTPSKSIPPPPDPVEVPLPPSVLSTPPPPPDVTVTIDAGNTIGAPPERRESLGKASTGSSESGPLILTMSPPKTPTPVSGDILLPLIIFSVVKANPSQLVSHLLYTQRFRNQSIGGEESYCLINLMAVVEFLENVDLGALGLQETEKVMSAADLTPIPIAQAQLTSENALANISAGLRGRVEQQVDAIAGSANKVISGVSGVVDSSFGVLRALLPTNTDSNPATEVSQTAPWNAPRPGFGLLRRESGFSIASLAASLPGGRERARSFASSHQGEDGQEMVESRPGSIKGLALEDGSSSERSDDPDASSESNDEDDGPSHDAKSIRSFESMMSGKSRNRADQRDRMSLTDRLANMSRLTRVTHSPNTRERQLQNESPPPSKRTSLLSPTGPSPAPNRFDTPASSRAPSPSIESKTRLAPPNRRFLECTADDIRISEVAELLQEYRRLVAGVRALGAFED